MSGDKPAGTIAIKICWTLPTQTTAPSKLGIEALTVPCIRLDEF